jgi:hypothetical protein
MKARSSPKKVLVAPLLFPFLLLSLFIVAGYYPVINVEYRRMLQQQQGEIKNQQDLVTLQKKEPPFPCPLPTLFTPGFFVIIILSFLTRH